MSTRALVDVKTDVKVAGTRALAPVKTDVKVAGTRALAPVKTDVKEQIVDFLGCDCNPFMQSYPFTHKAISNKQFTA